MKYEINFVPHKHGARGRGAVYVDETGLVIEGEFPRFEVPLLTRIVWRIVCTPSVRTIPFSKVIKYVPPRRWLRSHHRIVYALPNRSKRTVTFKVADGRWATDADFSARFEEFRSAAQSFSGR